MTWNIDSASFLDLSHTLMPDDEAAQLYIHQNAKNALLPHVETFDLKCVTDEGLLASVHWLSPSVRDVQLEIDRNVSASAVYQALLRIPKMCPALEHFSILWGGIRNRLDWEMDMLRMAVAELVQTRSLLRLALPYDLVPIGSASWMSLAGLPGLQELCLFAKRHASTPPITIEHARAFAQFNQLGSVHFPSLSVLRLSQDDSTWAPLIAATTSHCGRSRVRVLSLCTPSLTSEAQVPQTLRYLAQCAPALNELIIRATQPGVLNMDLLDAPQIQSLKTLIGYYEGRDTATWYRPDIRVTHVY